ncbi:NADAR family protein [bacterium]|nr:NADAR family protein [bacterium]
MTDPDCITMRLLDRHTREGRELKVSAAMERAFARLKGVTTEGAERELLLFWEAEASAGPRACLSNYFLATFVEMDLPKVGTVVSFHSVEQYMHYGKAVFCGDGHTALRILEAQTPRECRSLGREVQHFNDAAWSRIAKSVVERGVYLKFTQHAELARYLVNTGNAELVEASPFDARWGMFLSRQSPFRAKESMGLELVR